MKFFKIIKYSFNIFVFCITIPFRFFYYFGRDIYRNHIESAWLTINDYVKTRIIPAIESYDYIESYKIKYHCIPFKRNNIKIIIFLKESNHVLNVLLNNKNVIDLEDELNNMTTYAYIGKMKVIIKYIPELE